MLIIENMFVGIIVITVLGVVSTFLLKELERACSSRDFSAVRLIH